MIYYQTREKKKSFNRGSEKSRKPIVIQDNLISSRKRERERKRERSELLRLFVCITECPSGTRKVKRMGQDDEGAIRDWEKGAGALSFRRFSF